MEILHRYIDPTSREISTNDLPKLSDLTVKISSVCSAISEFIEGSSQPARKNERELPSASEEKIQRSNSIANDTPSQARMVDAEEIARWLGYDVSTSEDRARGRRYVHSLAKRNLIPFVRINRKPLRFDKAKVLEHLQKQSQN